MRYVFTGKQAKAIDTHAIQTMGFPSMVLMERAAMSVAAVIMSRCTKRDNIVCVCGTGNNGGDGVAVARMLHQSGYQSKVVMIGNTEHLSEETKQQLQMASNCCVPMLGSDGIGDADVIVDALFGIGLSRPIEGVYAKIIQDINEAGAYVVAVDVPSGVDATSGKILGVVVHANETITFGEHKIGMILYPGAQYAGDITVADIGFPKASVRKIDNPAYIYEPEDLTRMPGRVPYSNKGTYGKVLVIAGCESMSGACFFAAQAAYRMGCGLVKVVTAPENRDILLSQLPEILFSTYEQLEEGIEWADAIVVGPGLGRSERSKAVIQRIASIDDKPVLIDGDGLFYASDIQGENFILTPHLKEMTYLTGENLDRIKDNLLCSASQKAQNNKCIVALKDARTIVSDGIQNYINVSGNNGMSTGGSGDVLAGIIGGLLAQKMSPFEAAKLGVYIHGMAGDCMVEDKSQHGLLARDIIEGLMKIVKGTER